MALAWTKTRHSPIAIDFGADSLKLLQVVTSDPPQLIAAAAADLPEEARKSSEARQAFYANTLPGLVKSQAFKGRNAICAIPAYQTLTQHIQIARVEHEDFEAQIGLHLRQRLNVDPSRMIIRFFEVTQIVRDNASKQEVIILAASREAVMRHVEVAHRAKLEVVGIHCEPLAVIKAFSHLFRGAEAERTTCFIDLGGAATKVVIAHGPQMVFAKTIHAAGDHLTRHRAVADNITFMQAREVRIREASGAMAGGEPLVAAAANAPEPVLAGAGDGRPNTGTTAAAGQGATPGGGMAMLETRMAAERAGQEPRFAFLTIFQRKADRPRAHRGYAGLRHR